MKIQIGGLSEGIHRYNFEIPASELDLGEHFAGILQVRTVLDKSSTQVLLRSAIEATGQFECDRCVVPFDMKFSPSYTMLYLSEGSDTEHLDPTEVQVIPSATNVIDITEDVRQTLLLSVPFKLLCSESCKGLCPQCGQNLNQQRCECSDSALDSRWEKLRKLKSN